MNKFYNLINTIGLIAVIIILVFTYWARVDMLPLMSVFNFVSIFSLASIILILPNFLAFYYSVENKWFKTSEFYTIVLLILLGFTGLLFGRYSTGVSYVILPIGIGLALWELIRFIRLNKFIILSASVFFIVLIVLLFYSQDYHSPLFPEKIILGIARRDILSHSSISNMFSTVGYSTTGLDGVPYVNYHWGSHALFAGLNNWIGINTLMFYNIAYPALFIPLFLKSFFSFINKLSIYKGINSFNLLFAIAMLAGLYSAKLYNFNSAQPMLSESYCVSLTFTFLYGTSLLLYASKPCFRNMFFVFTIIVLLTISFLKISTGFVLVIGIIYLALRNSLDIRNILWITIGGIIIASLVYLFIFPEARTTIQTNISARIFYLWQFSNGFITYFLGIFIIIIIVLKNNRLSTWRKLIPIIKSKEYIELEVLFVINVAGFLGAMTVTSSPSDVRYFLATQLFIATAFLIFLSQKIFDKFISTNRIKSFFLILVIVLSIASRPKLILVGYNIVNLKQQMANLTERQIILKDYIIELFDLGENGSKENTSIFIPHSEKWYYNSHRFELASTLITPAISGIPLIGGISDSIFDSGYNYYSVYYYKGDDQYRIKDMSDAKKSASKKGYEELIKFNVVKGKLNKQIIKLSQ